MDKATRKHSKLWPKNSVRDYKKINIYKVMIKSRSSHLYAYIYAIHLHAEKLKQYIDRCTEVIPGLNQSPHISLYITAAKWHNFPGLCLSESIGQTSYYDLSMSRRVDLKNAGRVKSQDKKKRNMEFEWFNKIQLISFIIFIQKIF